MLSLDTNTLAAVVTSAKQSAADSPRWLTAIERAARELESNPYIEVVDDHTLLIGSASGGVYTSNGTCQCTAFQYGQPCFHRAAARIYQRYTEAQARTAKRAAYEQACADMDELFNY